MPALLRGRDIRVLWYQNDYTVLSLVIKPIKTSYLNLQIKKPQGRTGSKYNHTSINGHVPIVVSSVTGNSSGPFGCHGKKKQHNLRIAVKNLNETSAYKMDLKMDLVFKFFLKSISRRQNSLWSSKACRNSWKFIINSLELASTKRFQIQWK